MFRSHQKTEVRSQREAIEADIIEHVSAALDEILADAPEDWPRETTDAIKIEVLGHSEFVLGALGLSELRSVAARQAHVFNAEMDAHRLMNLKIAERRS